MKILVFAATNSTQSINLQLARYAASLIPEADVQVLDLNHYELPLFSLEREQQLGQPALAKAFLQKIADADALIVGFAEHNDTYTAAFKNLYEWTSRIERRIFQQKPSLFMATSPGSQGARGVLTQALNSAASLGANLVGSFSLPDFHQHFDVARGKLTTSAWSEQLQQQIQALRTTLGLPEADIAMP